MKRNVPDEICDQPESNQTHWKERSEKQARHAYASVMVTFGLVGVFSVATYEMNQPQLCGEIKVELG
jgi:hypothetical protein